MTLSEVMQVANMMAESGLWLGLNAEALAVRILAGLELGVGPVAAVSNLAIEKKKLTVSASLQAALLNRSGRWEIEVVEASDTVCHLVFGDRQTKTFGDARYTIEEAQRAGLLDKKGGPDGNAWTKYPADLLWASALKRGIKRFAPSLLVGHAAYSPSDLGAEPGVADVVHPDLTCLIGGPADTPEPQPEEQAQEQPPGDLATEQQLARMKAASEVLEITPDEWGEILGRRDVNHPRELTQRQAEDLAVALEHRVQCAQLEDRLYGNAEPTIEPPATAPEAEPDIPF